MNEVYIVYGRTGEYSDFREWAVCAYATKESADEHAALANKRSGELDKWKCPDCEYGWKYHLGACTTPRPFNEYDEEFALDYTGTDYVVGPVKYINK